MTSCIRTNKQKKKKKKKIQHIRYQHINRRNNYRTRTAMPLKS